MDDADDVPTRRERGKSARKVLPRSGMGEYGLRDRDPVEILRAQDAQRLPDLVPLRYGRMLQSRFAFYRGAAAIMAADLGSQPNTGLNCQLAGDAHLANFGGYASPERDLVFDLNDFDETHPGPFEWDLKRLLASFVVAARDRGMSRRKSLRPALAAAAAYRHAMAGFAADSRLEVWYARLDSDAILRRWAPTAGRKITGEFQRRVQRAKRKTSLRAAQQMTRRVDGHMEFVSNPPLVTPVREMFPADRAEQVLAAVRDAWQGYHATLQSDRRHLAQGYRLVDLARKVVGVGSVGTRCYVCLNVAARGDRDPLVLQIKEATHSVLHPYVDEHITGGGHGERVVVGQRLMQAASDIFLGWTSLVDHDGVERDFYVRQLWDWKESADLSRMEDRGFEVYAEMCAWTLARAHARSGDRYAVSAYLGRGDAADAALVAWADKYAAQNDADYARVRAAAEAGEIPYQDPAAAG